MSAKLHPSITWALVGLCILQILGATYDFSYFSEHGYLPAPFINDKSDTFMDFFHVMYWSDNPGRYTDWRSVYPPINFLLLRLIGWVSLDPTAIEAGLPYINRYDAVPAAVQYGGGFALRASSLVPIIALLVLYAASVMAFVASGLWKGFSGLQRALLFVVLLLSPPGLFALERGNLIILALPLLGFVFSWHKCPRLFALALIINIKPYFVLLLLAWALKGRFIELFYAVVAAGTIFVMTGMALDPNFLSFIPNIFSFADGGVFAGREVLAFPSSISAFSYALVVMEDSGRLFQLLGLGGNAAGALVTFANGTALAMALLILALYRDRLSLESIMAILVVVISNMGVWVGGYSMFMYAALVPTLFKMQWRWLYLGIVLVIFMPIDSWVLFTEDIGQQNVFLSRSWHFVDWQLTAATFIRPSLNFLLLVALSLEVVVQDFRSLSPARSVA